MSRPLRPPHRPRENLDTESNFLHIYHHDPAEPTVEEFEKVLELNVAGVREQSGIRANMYRDLGDQAYGAGNVGDAGLYYATSLGARKFQPVVWIKLLLLHLGKPGSFVRNALRTLRGSWFFGNGGARGPITDQVFVDGENVLLCER